MRYKSSEARIIFESLILYNMKQLSFISIAYLFLIKGAMAQDPVKLSNDPNKQIMDPGMAYAVDQYIYYVTPNLNSFKVWRSDGTVNGTKLAFDLSQINPMTFAAPQGFISVGGKVFVTLEYNADTSALMYFTHQDLQPMVVKLFKKIPFGGNTSVKHLRPMIAFNNLCWFGAEDFGPLVDSKGVELWSSDGTAAGTQMVADIISGGTAGFYTSSVPGNFLVHKNKMYFSALKWTGSGQNYQFVLYESDGTAANTKPFSNGSIVFSEPGAPYSAGAFKYKILNNELFVSYRRPDNVNQEEIYVYKVSEGGIPAGRTFFRFGDFGFLNNKIAISGIPASKGIMDPTGPELYTYDMDLSTASQTLVKDINSSSPGGYIQAPYEFKVLAGKLYMLATTSDATQTQIWETDLSAAGTKAVTNYKYNTNGMHFRSFQTYQGKLYFNVYDSAIGNELYKLNPADNSLSNWDLFTGSDNGIANSGLHYATGDQNLIVAGDIMYFTAIDSTFNYQLWKLGTPSTGLAKSNQSPVFKLYPNPTTAKLNIESKQQITHIELINSMGQVFRFEPNTDGSFEIDQAPTGFYICRIFSKNTYLSSQRILKE